MVDRIAIRDAYGEALLQLGGMNEKVVVLEADVGSSTKSILFGKSFPDRYFNFGIAELNMMSAAAGFANQGFIPFVNTFAYFMTTRASDPISSMISYDCLNVKLCGAYAGLSDSYDGASHQAICDLAMMTALPNMTITSVSDPVQTKAVVELASVHQGPLYLRLSRAPVPTIYSNDKVFALGKGIVIKDGNDVAIFATGYMVHKALAAARMLSDEGIDAAVIDIFTIKPIDIDLICHYARKTKAIITIEEHSVFSGFGSMVASVLSEHAPSRIHRIGLNSFAESGDYEALLTKYGLDQKSIYEIVKALYVKL